MGKLALQIGQIYILMKDLDMKTVSYTPLLINIGYALPNKVCPARQITLCMSFLLKQLES